MVARPRNQDDEGPNGDQRDEGSILWPPQSLILAQSRFRRSKKTEDDLRRILVEEDLEPPCARAAESGVGSWVY